MQTIKCLWIKNNHRFLDTKEQKNKKMTKNILLLTVLACLSAHSWPAVDGQVGFHI